MKPNRITFKKATLADIPDIVSLLANDELGRQREDPSVPLALEYRQAFQAIDADANQLLVIAMIASDVVGTLQLTFIPGIARRGTWRGQIEAVRISETYRSSGLGQEMFQWAITQCRKRNCRLVQLTTDKSRPDAHRFYERLGFRATHEGYKLAL